MKNTLFRCIKKQCLAWGAGFAILLFVQLPSSAAQVPLQGYVMQVHMTPAICALDRNVAKQRKCLEGYALTIAGLYPETQAADCTTKSSSALAPLQAKVVVRVMPDENARTQLWRTVGGCVPMNASQYFRTIINLAEKLKIPADLTSYEDKVIRQANLRAQFLKLNPSLPDGGLRFSCQNTRALPVLTEVKVCYTVNGQYRQCSSRVVTSCPSEFLIKGRF
ncbi:ribonuclease T2 [Acinetobacter calcoaceticus]|uniref:Ribonuclease T2 n=1 Tax=Acinetobacter calcoaceticus TaxID=471 RepID=A0A4V2R219_ACICA|nr:ribonuclease T2 [Acinetobacter calcoaceticus]